MSTIAAQPRIDGRVAPMRDQAVSGRDVTPAVRGQVPAVRADVCGEFGVRSRESFQRNRGAVSQAVPSLGRLRLTRRGRVVMLLLGLLLVVAGVMGGRAVAGTAQQATEVRTYAVQSGDTLWDIAQGVAQPGEDVRDVVLQLQRFNDLADGSLIAGEVLMLPVTE